jgi:hypothetical protein
MKRFAIAAATLLAFSPAAGRDNGNWSDVSPERSKWFQSLLIPNTATPCFGEADAYEADQFGVADDGNIIAIITDGTADPVHAKPAIRHGMRFKVPVSKVIREHDQVKTNPTGHGWLFVRKDDTTSCRAGCEHVTALSRGIR